MKYSCFLTSILDYLCQSLPGKRTSRSSIFVKISFTAGQLYGSWISKLHTKISMLLAYWLFLLLL